MKTWLMIRSDLRKSRVQTVAVAVLVLISAMLCNLWLMLTADYQKQYYRDHERLNSEHNTFSFVGGGDLAGTVGGALAAEEGVESFEVTEAVVFRAVCDYSGGRMENLFSFLKKDDALQKKVGQYEITEEDPSIDGLYLPCVFQITGNYDIGDVFTLDVGAETVSLPIAGFFQSINTSSYNCLILSVLLPEPLFDELAQQIHSPAVFASVRLTDPEKAVDFEANFPNSVLPALPGVSVVTSTWITIPKARYVTQSILSAIIGATTAIMITVTLVVISVMISDFIRKNLRELGIRKALGYKSRDLVTALLGEFLSITLPAMLAGAGLSYAVFLPIDRAMESQVGIEYPIHFLPIPFLVTIGAITAFVAVTVLLSARKIRRATPLAAFRSETPTGKGSQIVSLEKSRFPLHFSLALKTLFSEVRQGITVAVTMLVVSLCAVFATVLYRNVMVDYSAILNLVMDFNADSCVTVPVDLEDEFLAYTEANDRVTEPILLTEAPVRCNGERMLIGKVMADGETLPNDMILYAGQFPANENEAALGGATAEALGVGIGDRITLDVGGNEAAYTVTGLMQVANYSGEDCILTRTGYARMADPIKVTYYFDLTDGGDIDACNLELMKSVPGVTAINFRDSMQAKASGYVTAMQSMVFVLLILSILLTGFVLFLLTRNLIAAKSREYGVFKALGYKTGELVFQTAWSFLPIVLVTTAIGVALSAIFVNSIIAVFLGVIGVKVCRFVIPVGLTIGAGIGLILLSFLFCYLFAANVRKITPLRLFGRTN